LSTPLAPGRAAGSHRAPPIAGTLLIAAAVAITSILALVSGAPNSAPIGRGSPAPHFALPRSDGGPPVSLDDLRGKVVLVNFWATWCKPCEDEMPAMERLYRRLPRDQFELVAISVDDAPEPVEAFTRRLGLTFPIAMDVGQKVAAAWSTLRFPETLLVDHDGVVIERYVGAKAWDLPAYRARIERLLAAAPDAS
jgi:peroxiredoxin